jgi:Xaa-Pro aminopeptidase
MNNRIIKNRIKAIRQLLKQRQINLLIITKPANVTYTTGFLGGDSWVAITTRAVYLLTDSRYTEQAKTECPACRIIERTTPLPETVGKLIKKLKSLQTVTVEKSTSVFDFEAMKKNVKARLKSVANIIEEARSSKDKSEVDAIESAARIATQALKRILRYIKPRITENELAGMLDFQIRNLGAINSFETIVAFGSNASRPHHQPSSRKLKKNDTVLIDFGVKCKGYCCDLTRCFTVGTPTQLYKKVYNAVQEAQAAAIKIIGAGVEIRQVDAAARDVISKYDLPVYGHGTGHGLGIEIHENPFLNAENKGKLQIGEVITIEPGVYIPGKLGVRIEDNILVTETGYKILSRNCPQISLGG